MSAKLFKEKQKNRSKVHEVCRDCGSLKREDGGGAFTGSLGFQGCDCKPVEPVAPGFSLANPELSKQTPLADQARTEEIKSNLGDQYEMMEIIGQGGMGTVYRAKDKVLQKEFAIKILRDELAVDESAVKRFEQEATTASQLTHANILAVYGHGRAASGAPYIVMNFMEGESLAQLLQRETRLEPPRVVNVSMQICDALVHAHMKGLIHRDLKPSNVMLTTNDQCSDMVKVLDFGIAKIMPGANRETQNLTQTGDLFGSPSYMSPEQCLGCNLDARSDIYSLGCMMYEMLTGKPPFVGKNPIQTVVKHLNEEPAPIAKSAPDLVLPGGLESIIMRCLEKEAISRYQSMDQLRADLELISLGQAPKRKKRRVLKPIPLPVLLIVTLVIAGFVAIPGFLAEHLAVSVTVHAILDTCTYLLLLLCAALWTTALGQLCWKHFKALSPDTPKRYQSWGGATLVLLFMSCLCAIGLGISNPPGMAPSIGSSIVCCTTAILCFLMGVATSIGWLLVRIGSAFKLSPVTRRKLNILYIAALGAVLFLGRPLFALIPYSIGEKYDYRLCHTKDKFDEAKASQKNLGYEAAIFINPDFAEAYYKRGVRKLRGKQAGAIEDFTKVINLNPEKSLEANAVRDRAKVYFAAGNYDQALNDISRTIQLDNEIGIPKDGPQLGSSGWLGDCLSRAYYFTKAQQYEKALADYNGVIARYPTEFTAYAGRAILNEKLGNYEQALADYSFAIEWNYYSLDNYLARAGIYKKTGQSSKAIQDYKKVLEHFSLEKNNGTYQNNFYLGYNPYHCAAIAAEELGMQNEAKDYQLKAVDYDKRKKGAQSQYYEYGYFEYSY